MRVRVGLTVALSAAALGGVAAPAAATTTFRGHTTQGRAVTIRIRDDGRPDRVTVPWQGACHHGVFHDGGGYVPPFTRATPAALLDAGRYTMRQRGGLRLRIALRLAGRRLIDSGRPDSERWVGTLRAGVTVLHHGKVLDRCHARVAWGATLGTGGVVARLVMASDPGDFVGQGKSHSYDVTNAGFRLYSSPANEVSIAVAPRDGPLWWDVHLRVPARRFVAGHRYTGAARYPMSSSRPTMSVDGDGRACDTYTGEFTVTLARYDRRGRLKAFAATFEQHCEGGPYALRGSVDFERVP